MTENTGAKKIDILRPTFLVISGHSGAGKTTIREEITKLYPDAQFSLSMTTRLPRHEERDGTDYHFVGKDDFLQMIAREELLEYEEVHGFYYGTPLKPVEDARKKPGLMIFDVDVKGGLSLKKRIPEALLVFIRPPDIEALKNRLTARSTEDHEQIKRRLDRIPEEQKFAGLYDYVVTNDTVDVAVDEIAGIINDFQEK
ncbi:guanylate kinase [candidate division KSB1 bacterium]